MELSVVFGIRVSQLVLERDFEFGEIGRKKETASKKKKERKKEKEHNNCDVFLVKILHLEDTSLPFNVFRPNIN